MDKMENVINGLELCKQDGNYCYDKQCPYEKNFPKCVQSLLSDALELLKAKLSEQDNADLNLIHDIRSGRIKKAVCKEYAIYNGDWYRSHPWNLPNDDEKIRLEVIERGNIGVSDAKYGKCPWCGAEVYSDVNRNYCGNCGQAVKWSE